MTACERDAGAERPGPRPVHVLVVKPGTIDNDVVFSGDIQAQNEVAFSFRIGGKLLDRPLNVGDHVSAGQILARLDPQTEANDVRAAEATEAAARGQVTKARNAFSRQEELMAQGFTTRPLFDQAQQALRTAQAQLDDAEARSETARDRLGFTELRADAEGIVTARGAEPGEVVRPGQMILQVARANGRDAVFDVPAAMLRSTPRDPIVRVALASDPAVMATGRLREVATQADPATRTFRVRVGLDLPPREMALGASVVGRMALDSATVISVPASALTASGQDPAIWVVDPVTMGVSLRPVVVLRYGPSDVTISEGLKPGETVVVAGSQALHPGQVVKVLPARTASVAGRLAALGRPGSDTSFAPCGEGSAPLSCEFISGRAANAG
ncbi:efflux RND transporter periplasmic adaptor subunit [Microvirga antarctica]|uniref:efflux RND transporter periplasmic adaptor subunit n=1 Tax=Microvirga antarctica TaxID=2819233 RepID=UPI001FE27460|nr:efflux RND transporter periplasmic adaptor subunit [Microvirga antarctica]